MREEKKEILREHVSRTWREKQAATEEYMNETHTLQTWQQHVKTGTKMEFTEAKEKGTATKNSDEKFLFRNKSKWTLSKWPNPDGLG